MKTLIDKIDYMGKWAKIGQKLILVEKHKKSTYGCMKCDFYTHSPWTAMLHNKIHE